MKPIQNWDDRLVPTAAGLGALVLLLALWCLLPGATRDPLRERTFDALLPLLPTAAAGPPNVIVLDIDREVLGRFGPWPWPRARLAKIVAAAAAAHPAAIGIDILLAGRDRFSTGGVPDGDASLARAVASAPTALGFAIELGAAGQPLPSTPVLMAAPARLPGIWRADGVVGPMPEIASAAQGFGTMALAADRDGPIRRVPLLVSTAGILRPGLAVETVRLAQGAGALLVDPRGWLHIGAVAVPLGADAALRLVPRPPSGSRRRTVSATMLLDDARLGSMLTGRIVLIGGSAPELGGLRVTPASAASPSVQIQADAIEALLSGDVAYRPTWLDPLEAICATALGFFCLVLAVRMRPLLAAAATVLACLVWAAAAMGAVREFAVLTDPAGPVMIAVGTFGATALVRFVRDEWRGRLLRASFEQRLAPEVVRRILADPASLRLRGEAREVTAMFSDIEGFTAMTERAEPADLVALLDTYFDVATRVVTQHGGMVVKIIGDAVHAIFNAPFALDAHPECAVACARALLQATEELRRSPAGQRLQLGRTRIGIETGRAIVGDVGGATKLDYTAYGNAVNTAARLEAAGKELGVSICIGPGTAAHLDPAALRHVDTLTPRGQSRAIRVFTPADLD